MDIFRYYGSDWIAVSVTFLAIYLLGNKNKFGFILMIIGNFAWIVVGFQTNSLAMIIANIGFLGLNIRGLYKWAKNKENTDKSESTNTISNEQGMEEK